jgi:hypothetical protein
VQIPAAALIPDTPDWDFVNQVIAPYGQQDYGKGLVEALLPGYARNLRAAFEQGDPRLFANTVGSSMDYLASTGDYDLRNPDEYRQLFDDAKAMARNLYKLRAFAQFFAPTSPLPSALVEDESGGLHVAQELIKHFHDLENDPDVGYENATAEFLKEFGGTFAADTLGLLMQGKSAATTTALPVSKASAEWERKHQDIVKRYPLTWGLFAPSGEGDEGDLDFQALTRQFARGERQSLTPEQRLLAAQARLGRMVYDNLKAKVGDKPTAEQREWLGAARELVRQRFPGFGQDNPGMPTKAPLERVISEMRLTLNNPRLSATRQGQAARAYLDARDRALAFARAQGVKSLSAKAAEPARLWLARAADLILQTYPEFGEFFDAALSRELNDA